MKKLPELLSPAGDYSALTYAIQYGADAVYIGGQNFSLRERATNFNIDEMREGVNFAHAHGVKVYVTINIYAHNEHIEKTYFWIVYVPAIVVGVLALGPTSILSEKRGKAKEVLLASILIFCIAY